MATRETTCSKTCIDLFFCNFEGVRNVDKTALSDHYRVFFSATCFPILDSTAAFEFKQYKHNLSTIQRGEETKEHLERNKLSIPLEIRERRLMIESLGFDQSIEWLQQTISSSK